MIEVKHPEVKVRLTGKDGNAFMVMGLVSSALKKAGYAAEVDAYLAEAMSGDYGNLLRVSFKWVTCS